jgi:hypothetical protein
MSATLPALNLIAEPGRRRATLDTARERIVKLTATSEKGIKRSKRSHCRDRVAPLVGCLGSEDPQRGA